LTSVVELRALRLGHPALLVLPVLLAACSSARPPAAVPALPWAPRLYLCLRVAEPPDIDGRLDDAAWRKAEWTADFVDIEGALKPRPRYRTRVKMVWDDRHLYVAAELEDPHVWATLEKRDSVVYQDNDFELFADPDADTHHYFELEINALGTEWDLLLEKPYRDGGPARTAWTMRGLRTAVHVDGTLNDPRDIDRGWRVEIAVPWSALERATPRPGERWRMNFSRVQWRALVKNKRYVKVVDKSRPESEQCDNWVWSPQGLVNMHFPERWGIVQFGTRPDEKVVLLEEDRARIHLYGIYYRQRRWKREKGTYFSGPDITATRDAFEATVTLRDGRRLAIREDGRTWWQKGSDLAGSDRCATCHEQEARFRRYGAHRTVDCERCHGPGAEHARADGRARLTTSLEGADLCLSCHKQGADPSSGAVSAIESFEDHLRTLERDHRIKLDRRKSGTACVYCHDPHLLE
jgi:hypothetical protein